MTTQDLVEELSRADIEHELVRHRRTERAADEAAAVGVSQAEIGKTLILKSGDTYVRAVVPASERLNLRHARELLDDRGLRLATEEELADAYPGFELGAVPPFGGPAGDRVVVDRRIAQLDRVTFEAGAHEESLTLRPVDLIELTKATVLDLCRQD